MNCIKVGSYEIDTSEIVSGAGNVEGGNQILVLKSNAIGQSIKNFCGYIIKSSSIKNQKINQKQLINKNNSCFNVLNLYGFDQQNDLNIYIGEKCDYCLQYFLTSRKQYPLNEQEIFDILGQIVNGYIDLLNQQIKLNLNSETIYLKKVDNQVIVKLFDYIYDFYIQEPYGQLAYNYRYFAPETLINSQNCDQRSDIFSLGIILYQICYFQHPYHQNLRNKENLLQQYQQLYNQPIYLPDSPSISNDLKFLIKKMLLYNPNDRITWQNLQTNRKLNLKFVILDNLYYVNFDKKIGSGAQGVVYLAINIQNNQQFCAKRITNNQPESWREIKIYEQLLKQEQQNYNIIQIYQIISYDKQYTYIIMEKCDENLEEYYQKNKQTITDSNVIEFLLQVTNGYMFLKQNNIIHRDLKPQNILIKYFNYQPVFKELATSLAGTPLFSAPEVFNEDGGNYNHQCDIYSLGAILYYMIYDQSYVNVQTLDQLKQKFLQFKKQNIICPNVNFQNKPVDQNIIDLIQQMIVYDPNKRITWENLKIRLEEINKNHIAKGLNQKIRIVNVSNQPIQQLNNQQIINQNQNQLSEEFNKVQQPNKQNGSIINNVNQQNKIKILCQVNNFEQQNNLYINQPQIIQVNQQQDYFQNQNNYSLKQNNQEIIKSINPSNEDISYSQNLDKQLSSIQQKLNLQETQKASHTNSKIRSTINKQKSIKHFKTLDEFQNYFIEFIINKKATVIDIAEYIFFLIVASRKVYSILIENIKDTQIEIIIILELIKLFTEVCVENLHVLQVKKYLFLENIEYEIESNFLDEIMPQNFIILKREIRKQRPINNTFQVNNIYLQQIKIYHERLSKQRCETFLDGLTYFQEFYQKKAERLQLTEIQKNYLQKLYSITETVKYTQNQHEFDVIMQQFQ